MKDGLLGTSCEVTPSGDDSDDMIVKFRRADGDYMIGIYVLFPGARQMKGVMKITPKRAGALMKWLSTVAEFEDDADYE